MLFYRLKYKNQKEEVGNFPQISTQDVSFNRDSHRTLSKIKYSPIETPNLNPFLLRRGSRLTDLISTGFLNKNFCILISNEMLDVLQNYLIVEFQIIPVELIDNDGGMYEYVILKLNSHVADHINFNVSNFYLHKSKSVVFEISKGNSELIQHLNREVPSSKFNGLRFNEIVFNEGFSLDLFSIFNVSQGIIVSERLKNSLEESRFTGIEFEVLPNIVVNQIQQL